MHRIYAFSGTGATLHLAERVAEKLGETELVNMAHFVGKGPVLAEGETVGIVYPVHAFGAPVVAHRFIENLTLAPGSWCYLLIDSAGGPMGALSQGVALLAKRGIHVHASFHVKMPGNYPPVSNPPAGEKMLKIVRKADAKIADIVAVVRAKCDMPPRDFLGCFGRFLTNMGNHRAVASVHESDKRFFADDKCTKCGVCARVCPVGDIEYDDAGRPKWKKECTGCFACFNWCPAQAIQYSKKSHTKNRYHHPAITLQRFLEWSEE